MKRLVFFVFSSLIVFGVTIFFRLGGHKDVKIQIVDQPEMRVLYKDHVGAYHTINTTIQTVETWAATQNLDCRRTFGLYLDDPRLVEERRLRSEGGCVLMTESAPASLPENFKWKVLAPGRYVSAVFEGAPSIGPFKVYPRVEEFLQQNRLRAAGPVLELYSFSGDRKAHTEYLFFLQENAKP